MCEATKQRYVWLFLLAIAVPSIAVAWIGARLIRQDQELEESRRVTEQRRIVGDVRLGLLDHLEGLKAQEVSSLMSREFAPSSEHADPAIVISGIVRDRRLLLPWETTLPSRGVVQDSDNPRFAAGIRRGSAAELSQGNSTAASRSYGEALTAAQNAGQETRARFLLARALSKTEGDSAWITHYRTILESDMQTVDEFGVPYALWAVRQLLQAGVTDPLMADLFEAELARGQLVTPIELSLLLTLASSLASATTDSTLRSKAGRLVRSIEAASETAEQALGLQREFLRLGLMPLSESIGLAAEPFWTSWGDSWLVSVSPRSGGLEGVLVAVRQDEAITATSRDIVASSAGESFEILGGPSGTAQSLAPTFPGLSVRFTSPGLATGPLALRRAFLLAALMLVLSVTLGGGYFFWRDFRRELGLAELRSEFVSLVSHELKTPLTSIRMFAETLQMHGVERMHERTEYLDTIVSESQRLTRLLDNVLEFSRIERGAKRYAPEPSSLAEIVQASARTMRYPYEREGFKLDVDVADGLPDVDVDRDAIEQAILNLLTNAMKYSDTDRSVRLGLRRENGYALIEVMDQGIGIAPEDHGRIFEQFYRVPSPDGDSKSGTGLGLTLVRHIAEAHGGHVSVRSNPAQGSTFSLHLPLEEHSA